MCTRNPPPLLAYLRNSSLRVALCLCYRSASMASPPSNSSTTPCPSSPSRGHPRPRLYPTFSSAFYPFPFSLPFPPSSLIRSLSLSLAHHARAMDARETTTTSTLTTPTTMPSDANHPPLLRRSTDPNSTANRQRTPTLIFPLREPTFRLQPRHYRDALSLEIRYYIGDRVSYSWRAPSHRTTVYSTDNRAEKSPCFLPLWSRKNAKSSPDRQVRWKKKQKDRSPRERIYYVVGAITEHDYREVRENRGKSR